MVSASAGWLRHFTRLHSAHPNPVIVTVSQLIRRPSNENDSNTWLGCIRRVSSARIRR